MEVAVKFIKMTEAEREEVIINDMKEISILI